MKSEDRRLKTKDQRLKTEDGGERGFYRALGQRFYEWYKEGKVVFDYANRGEDLEIEIERISELIEYVESKKRHDSTLT